jgi:flagellar export protein FliJ
MKAFSFRLDSVLETRRTQELKSRQAFAGAIDEHRRATKQWEDSVAELNRLLEEIARDSTTNFSNAARQRAWSMRHALEKSCTDLRQTVQDSARVVEERRAAMILARTKREPLDRLKQRQFEAWRKEDARVAQHQLDEFAMIRRHRIANSTTSL